MLFKLIEDLLNGINIIRFVDINQDIIYINNNKDILSFCPYFIDIFQEAYGYIENIKRHYLIFKIIICDTKNHLPLGFFANSYCMVSTGLIKLDKFLGPT